MELSWTSLPAEGAHLLFYSKGYASDFRLPVLWLCFKTKSEDVKFMLTGFSREKEKEIEGLIRKYGGIVLVDIPSPSNRGKRCSRHKFQQLPIVLCPKKV
ncbi:hypothetical protein COLO4_04921 [Corchorus olitorius]|uniref:Uncharacterized protein n=1 Tax=Corchorus olitorius TaxID=93759 RepID=A0A1R3KSE5_9ROSI|nr:hypothetical protein COLO4_04921 [Corchorus olitorius]